MVAFIYIFVMIKDFEHPVLCLYAIFISSLMSVNVFCLFFNWVVVFLTVEFSELFIYSRYSTFLGYTICKDYSPSWYLVFVLSLFCVCLRILLM